MRLNGVWIGWGLGDWSHYPDGSDRDPTVRRFKAFARRMYRAYMGHLADSNKFDQQLFDAVIDMQDRLVRDGRLQVGFFVRGVLDEETQYASAFKKRPASLRRPVIITIEGHLSNMWIGPCAAIGAQMEAEGLAWHQPIDYDRVALPFNNRSGVFSVLDILHKDRIGPLNDRPFDEDVDIYLLGFSQGAMIGNEVYEDHLRHADPNTLLGKRSKRLKRAIMFGDPWREKGVRAGWWPDEPGPDTQGINERRMVNTPPWWKSANRRKDIYADNPDNEIGLNRTAICNIAANNKWIGGQAAIFARVMDFFRDPFDGIVDITGAIIGGVLFVGNMDPHGGYNLDAPTDYIRRGLRGEPQPR